MPQNSSIDSLKDKIWFTVKCRIRAERRHKQYDQVSSLLISALSVCVIGVNLSQRYFSEQAPISEYTIFVAVFILALSLIVSQSHFEAAATLHRECYLRLQKIASEIKEPEELSKAYNDILAGYPNHSQLDYEAFIIESTLYSDKKLFDSGSNPIRWNRAMVAGQLWHAFLLWIVPFILVAACAIAPFKLWH